MTGKELIMYILQNNLENEQVIGNDNIIGFMSVEETAAKFSVGYFTVLTWYAKGMLKGITINGVPFFPKDIDDPRKAMSDHE